MRSASTDFTDFTDLSKPFFLPDEKLRVVSQVLLILLILQVHPNLFFLPDEISLRNHGDPPCPIQSVKFIKTLSPHMLFDKKKVSDKSVKSVKSP